jgi:hypothetical protein
MLKIIHLILFKGKIDILSFIGFSDFLINIKLGLLFLKVSRIQYKIPKIQNKRVNNQMYNNPSLLKGFKKFLTGGSCRLPLETGYLDTLWLMTT